MQLGRAIVTTSRSRTLPATQTFRYIFFFDGFHAMVTALDLGQFVAYDTSGAISKPTWSSFMSLGGQLGWLVGSPANNFLIAADFRYAPSLFTSASTNTPQQGGALRFGVYLAYYIPLFDFN